MLELNKIYNMDSIDGIKLIPNNIIDLCVTDPPYKLTSGGINKNNIGIKKPMNGIMDKNIYDNKGSLFKIISFKEWIPEVYRVLKNDADFYVMTNDKNLQEILNTATQCGFKLHNILVWHKGNYTPNRWYMKSCEFTLYFWKGKAKPINNKSSFQINMTKCKMGNRYHPTEKPIELMKEYINNSSIENDIILDLFMGSGTTAIASKKLNRKFIGFEIDKKYYEIANERIKS